MKLIIWSHRTRSDCNLPANVGGRACFPHRSAGSNDPDALGIAVAIDGETVQRSSTTGLVRPVARLIADVTEFMTLFSGDVLTVGVAAGAPRARAGQTVTISIHGVGQLENKLVAGGVA